MADHVEDVLNEAKAQLAPRAGWSFRIPGSWLPPTVKRWTKEQREKGLKLGFFYLTPTEEETAISNAVKSGRNGAAMLFQSKEAFRKIDDELIAYEDRMDAWDAIGPQARNAANSAFQRAMSVSEEDSTAVVASFSLDT